MPSDCIFCRIVAGEVPADEVAASPLSFAFRDANPAMPVHVLVVPRRHIVAADTIEAADADVLADMFLTAQEVARREHVAERGYRLVFNVGDDGLKSIAHLHLHVLGGQRMGWPPG
jgi:histidine triad (HIT) family protein